MKKLVLVLLLIISLNLVSASITLKDFSKKEFKIGEKIDTSAVININTEEQYFFNAEIFCSSYKLDFYKTPINKNSNYIDIPALDINKNFLGQCQLKLKITDLNNDVIEEKESEKITIKNKLNLEFTTDKEDYNPGENIIIKGKSEKDSKIIIIFSDDKDIIEQYEEIISGEIFLRNIKLSENSASGSKKIIIKAEDKYQNNAEAEKEIKIFQVPKSIKLEIENKEINPYDEIIFNAYVFDQSETKMNLEISYRIFDTESNVINSITSSEKNSLKLENPIPGEYLIKAIYKNLEDSDKFLVKEYKKIEISTKNGVIVVENKGNVRYADNIEIEAKTESITYKIPVNLDLRLNEKFFIDLKNELPSNNYDLTLNSEKENYDLDNIKVDDNRPLVKKLSQGISQITGSLIIETDETDNLFYFAFFVVFIGFLIIFFASKKFKRKDTEFNNNFIVSKKEKNMIKEMF